MNKGLEIYKNKKILVFGAGLSGVNAALFLQSNGAKVSLIDQKKANEINDYQRLIDNGIKVFTESDSADILENEYELIVKNPGIPYTAPIVKKAKEKNIPIITEVEIASEMNVGGLVGVTGSNGKTTTTTMIDEMLSHKKDGKSFKAGNIGISATQTAQNVSVNDILILELSSFMLLGITDLKPHVAVITNIFSNHLDYHLTRENYINAKMRITENQDENDYLVINFDEKEWENLSKKTKAQVVPFSRLKKTEKGAYQSDGKLYFKDEFIIDVRDIFVPGEQNVENALAAIATAKIYNINNEDIAKVLKTFSGVRHRVQYVLTDNNDISYYNDSKATDIEATQMAIRGLGKSIVLIAGGLDRGYKFDGLVDDFKNHLKGIVLYGQTAQLMKEAALEAGLSKIEIVKDLKEATKTAISIAESKDVVLLSPANASWDQFDNFEDRGNQFISEVEKITKQKEKM
ncbi:UDP-N-acetylmuramoyl-L-alanine--D-glutamate ligase [Lactobacillus sp. S2-2]|uniref:UDP-N-acetylmuramoyl-L-alanine--D-glutamate ligase n=1 Tax=Lactobacillus sp. S2-2 TaxID=2692917 RepID=UPI001F03057E|nr:UDP-N-acetylmuramoyl-L-alanine--D-glutamate ligase [Lactobacillus sp. S2-2]MCF6514854.1 UDP-N-acetylmuramoyl-L-alanine--D-glutamate ligase [Lactobacillus sp. S2-2]